MEGGTLKRLLVQLDSDRLPSSFDRVVAYDGGADEVLSYGGVTEQDVCDLVYGAIFTRAPKDLRNTALFLGGSHVRLAERTLKEVQKTFFGPFRVSVMLDPSGANTTAAAAVRRLVRAFGGEVRGRRVVVFAGTGAVGSRAAGLFARQGAEVRITALREDLGREAAEHIRERFGGSVSIAVTADPSEADEALEGAELLLACGPEGARLVPQEAWRGREGLRVVADVNAVPPVGIEGVEPTDDCTNRDGALTFGATAIGRLKLRLHRTCIARLFEKNDLVLDAETIYDLAAEL